jgi:poly-gamma-glutamate synthesis protein (capsule biosynthesis protein)
VLIVGVIAAWGGDVRRPGSDVGPASSAVAASSAPGTVTVAAVGDMCFATSVRQLIGRSGAHAPFSATHALLSAADVTVGNLECALSTRGSAVPGKSYTFEGPPSAVKGLTWAGFDLVAQANNHARDYGSAALADTIKNLDKAGIAHAGAGSNSTSAFKPAYVTRNGTKIAYLSYSQIGPASFQASAHRSGTAYTLRLSTVTKAIKAAKKKADYVFVSIHWGTEYRTTPTSRQVEFGRAAVRAGATLVLSHHPHVIEGVEFYRKGLIAYSLGNFVFSPGHAAGHDTFVLTLTLGRKGITNVVARPMHIDPYGRPKPATGSARTRILHAIASTSRGRHTKVTLTGGVAKLRK